MTRELERERDVILQEIAAANDPPDDLVFDLAQSASFGDHPLGRSILGTQELIAAREPRNEIMAWRDRNYWASRMVVAAAGNIDHEKLAEAARKLLGKLRRGQQPAARAVPVSGRHRAEVAKAAGPNSCSAFICGAKLPRSRDLSASGAVESSGRRHVIAAVPGGPRKARAVLQRVLLCLGL